MITLTIPEWFLYLILFACIASLVRDCLRLYVWHLKRKIQKLKEQKP